MAQVHMTLEEFNELKSKTTAAETRCVELEHELHAARSVPSDQKTDMLREAYQHAKACVDFMVAQLDPEFIRAMPWRALEVLAELVEHVGGDGHRDHERAAIWREHAARIVRFETERQLRDRQPKLVVVTPTLEPVEANKEGT